MRYSQECCFSLGAKGGSQARRTRAGRPDPAGDEGLGEAEAVEITASVPGHTIQPTPRIIEVGQRFGVPMSVAGRQIAALTLDLRPPCLTLVTGPSGSGKSMLLAAIARQKPLSRLVNETPFPRDVAVLDAIAPARPMQDALAALMACGLAEPMLWIRRFQELSDGERFRARMARAISLHQRARSGEPLIVDEFCALLHRRLAKSIAFNLRKLVDRENLSLVVATSQDDLAADLAPDTVIRLGDQEPEIERLRRLTGTRPRVRGISFARRMRIERGTLRDYEQFAPMHYRQRDQVGFVDKVFVMREGSGGPALGIVVYGHPALELALRNRCTHRRFVRNAKRLNRDLRVLKRLVIHPDIRGCGLGHWLVRKTLPLAGTRFVECLAAMGAVHPVFDKAGMRRIGTVEPPMSLKRILKQLRTAGADPLAWDFVRQVVGRPTVRKLVAQAVFDWYRSTTGGGERRVARQSPETLAQTFRRLAGSQPVYFIWARDAGDWDLIERHAPDPEKHA